VDLLLIIQDHKNKKRMLNNDYYKSLNLFRIILNENVAKLKGLKVERLTKQKEPVK